MVEVHHSSPTAATSASRASAASTARRRPRRPAVPATGRSAVVVAPAAGSGAAVVTGSAVVAGPDASGSSSRVPASAFRSWIRCSACEASAIAQRDLGSGSSIRPIGSASTPARSGAVGGSAAILLSSANALGWSGYGPVPLDRGVQRRAQRPHVGGRRGLLAASLLRGEVRRGAGHHPGLGQGGVAVGAGDAEVGDLGEVVVGHQDVPGLDVAVHGAARVRRRQPVGDLGADPRGPLGRERAVVGHDLRQRAAGDVLHHQPDVVPLLDRVVDRDDVAVVERGGGPGLAHGPGEVRRGLTGQAADLLDRDRAAEQLVAAEPDAAHPATAHLALHVVAAGDGLGWHAAPLDVDVS